MGALTFHTKHMTVEAYRWDGENEEAIGAWGDWADVCIKTSNPPYLVVPGQRELARVGDWIIRGADGVFFSCPPHVFDRVYAHELEAGLHGMELVRDGTGRFRIRCACKQQPPAHRDPEDWIAEHMAFHRVIDRDSVPEVITWR